jgi:hypothetical protein
MQRAVHRGARHWARRRSEARDYGVGVRTSADISTRSIRDAYLEAAATVAPLLRDPAVSAAWEGPSALAEFSVRGLAGHLASQIFMVGSGLAGPSSDLDAISVSEHYSRVAWIDASPDSEFNTTIRANGEQAASVGADALADQVEAAVRDQSSALPAAPSGHRVTAPSGEWSLAIDDFALTRLMEIAVHSDDLAVSVGLETPALPDDTVMPVVSLLAGIALRRHGQVAMLRALSRRERAPATITAF